MDGLRRHSSLYSPDLLSILLILLMLILVNSSCVKKSASVQEVFDKLDVQTEINQRIL